MSTIINIDHEAGNLSEYDSTQTDSGDLSAGAAAALASTDYGMAALVDDTNDIYGQANISAPASDKIRIRFYFDPNSFSFNTNIDEIHILEVGLGAPPWQIARITCNYNGSDYQVLYKAIEDSGASNTHTESITDAPHYIEFYLQRASTSSSNDGTMACYLDGSLLTTLTGIDNYNAWTNITKVELGAVRNITSGDSGTFYLDELKANDDGSEIGALSTSIATFRRRLEDY
jgi:hypothetical protein